MVRLSSTRSSRLLTVTVNIKHFGTRLGAEGLPAVHPFTPEMWESTNNDEKSFANFFELEPECWFIFTFYCGVIILREGRLCLIYLV